MRPLPRAAAAALLAAAGLLPAARSPEARLIQPQKPPEAAAAESGGRGVSPTGRPPPGCLGAVVPGIDYALFGPFSFGAACLGMQHAEAMARYTAAVRLSLPDHASGWRAPRLARRAALLRRLEAERNRKALDRAH